MYKNLAKHGRFGDTEIAKTSDGSLWHVNKLEKKLIDEHGEIGENVLDQVPSTINPKTGKEEKWLAAAAMFVAGLAQQFGATQATREQGREQIGFYDESLAALEKDGGTLQDVLAPSLQLAQEKAKRTYETGSEIYGRGMEKLKSSKDKLKHRMKFAKGPDDDEDIKLYRKEAERKLEDIDIKLTEDLSSVLSQHEKQKFEMETQRQQLENQRKLAQRQSQQKYFGIF